MFRNTYCTEPVSDLPFEFKGIFGNICMGTVVMSFPLSYPDFTNLRESLIILLLIAVYLPLDFIELSGNYRV